MSNAKEVIQKKSRIPERRVTIYLDSGLYDEYERLEQELEAEEARVVDSLSGNPRKRELAAQIESLREEMEDCRLDFRLRKLAPIRWQTLVDAHQPRKDADGNVHRRDRYMGVNVETFQGELIRACTVEPELDDEDWKLLLGDPESEDEEARVGRLNSTQFDKLFGPAWELNRSAVDVPFSVAASRILSSEAE